MSGKFVERLASTAGAPPERPGKTTTASQLHLSGTSFPANVPRLPSEHALGHAKTDGPLSAVHSVPLRQGDWANSRVIDDAEAAVDQEPARLERESRRGAAYKEGGAIRARDVAVGIVGQPDAAALLGRLGALKRA